MKANYHTHTYRCGHGGAYRDEEYVLQAIESGLTVLGFSDHTPWPYPGSFRHPSVRMDVETLPEYLASIDRLKEQYRGQIQIYVGLECEYFPAYLPWLSGIRDSLDYLILGNHWGLSDEHGELYYSKATQAQDVEDYFRYTIQGMETGLFTYVAHPDHVLSDYPAFDAVCAEGSHALCRKAKELGLPLEFNLLGFEKRELGKQKGIGFPNPDFWKIAQETGCTAIIGCDAHRPDQLANHAAVEKAEAFLQGLGISLLETLPGLGSNNRAHIGKD